MMKHETHPIRGDDTKKKGDRACGSDCNVQTQLVGGSGLGGSGRQTDLNLSMTG